MRLTRLAGVGTVVAGLLLSLGACATRAPYNEVILYYAAGDLTNTHFQECIAPGKSGSAPVNDETYPLPANKRQWNIRPSNGDTADPIQSGTHPGPDGPGPGVGVYANADFYLNIDCSKGKDSPIVRLWEDTLQRYGVSTDTNGSASGDGEGFNEKNWVTALYKTLVPAEEDAIRAQTRLYTADDLDNNVGDIYARIERAMAPQFQQSLRDKLGGDFFCGVGYAGGKEVAWKEWVPDVDESGKQKVGADGAPLVKEEDRKGSCPPIRVDITDINYSDPNVAASRAKVYAADQERRAKLIEADGELQKSNILGQAANNEAYLKYKQLEAQSAAAEACKANPNCTVIIDQTGNGGVNVNAGKK